MATYPSANGRMEEHKHIQKGISLNKQAQNAMNEGKYQKAMELKSRAHWYLDQHKGEKISAVAKVSDLRRKRKINRDGIWRI